MMSCELSNSSSTTGEAKTPEIIRLIKDGVEFSAYALGEGPLVLLLHGFPDGPLSYRYQLQALAAAGFRAVAPTLRGYERSSLSPQEQYYAVDMAADTIAWLDELKVEKAHLVGHDWGASIACAAANLAPQRWLSLSMLAVPHPGRFQSLGAKSPRQLLNSWYLFLFQLRGLAEWMVRRKDYALLEYLWRKWSPNWMGVDGEMPALKQRFRQAGVLEASLCYYRRAVDFRSAKGRQSQLLLNKVVDIPTLGLSGVNDGCIDHSVFLRCMQVEDFKRGLRLETIDSAGHFLQLEQPHEVNRLLIEFLSENN